MVNHLFKLAQEKVGLGAMTIAVGLVSTIIFLPSAESFKKVVVNYKPKYVHKVLLVNHLFKLAKEKVGLGQHTILP